MSNSISYLEKLIAFPTVSRDSNLDLVAYVQGVLKSLGVESSLVHNEDGTKANLWATIGPTDVAGVAFVSDIAAVVGDNSGVARTIGRYACDRDADAEDAAVRAVAQEHVGILVRVARNEVRCTRDDHVEPTVPRDRGK